jgi:hypothetical protein
MRPSQITTFLNAPRYDLNEQHRQGFLTNGYDRQFGHVYMHWAQIGKTLYEVYRDENAPRLDDTVCSSITHLKYYSGEFDIEWGRSVVAGENEWYDRDMTNFKQWLLDNDIDPNDLNNSLGYLPLGHVDLAASFGTEDPEQAWKILSQHLDIYSISVNGVTGVYDYCWSDPNHYQQQIDKMKPGYDYSSRKIC